LIFRVYTGTKLFSRLPSNVVHHNLESGIFPNQITTLEKNMCIAVLGLWSPEFAQFINSAKSENMANTMSTASKIVMGTGVAVAGAAFLATPIAWGIGFGAGGVVAGSAAAGLQSAFGGAVGAGSLFAFFQSLGAGGYAAATMATTALAGGGTAAAGGAAWAGSRILIPEHLKMSQTEFGELVEKLNKAKNSADYFAVFERVVRRDPEKEREGEHECNVSKF